MSILNKEVPTQFGMFTKAGNRRLESLSRQLLARLDKVHRKDYADDFGVEGKGPRTGEKKAYAWYFESYRKMCSFKSYVEAGDTAVRDSVWCFAESCTKHTEYVSSNELDEVWHS